MRSRLLPTRRFSRGARPFGLSLPLMKLDWRSGVGACALLLLSLLTAPERLHLSSRAALQQTCAPRPNGLIAWYRAEGNGDDSVGTNHGTLRNGVTFTTGKVGQAFQFNGGSEVAAPNSPSLNPARITIEGWVYPTAVDGGVDIIVNKDFEPYDGYQYELGIRGPDQVGGTIPVGNFAFALRGVNGLPNEYFFWVNGGAAVPLNTWTHLAVTYDGSVAVAYFNGVPTRTVTGLSGDITPENGPLKIGSRSEEVLARLPKERFNGNLDEISLYNRALSAAEILAIYSAGMAGKCPTTNTLPTITPGAPLTRQQGAPGSVSTLATVTDPETAAGNLVVTATTVPPGLTVSNLTNNNGTISGNIAATCTATAGANVITLTVTDANGGTATANLTVNVTANPAPVLGVYPTTTLNVGANATISPSAAPTDNNALASLTVAASAGFAGSLAINANTGVITLGNARPAGSYVVTVTATDNCGASSSTPFNLTINKFNSATALTLSSGPYLTGQPITFTARVTGSGAGNPTGNVSFFAGSNLLGTAALNAAGEAALTLTNVQPGQFTVEARYPGDANYNASVSGGTPIVVYRPLANVSAASYRGDQFAREQIIAAFGTNLANDVQTATTQPLPTSLGGTTITVKDSAGTERPAPLFFVSPNQINYLMPAGTANGTATVIVTNGANQSLAIVQIANVAPGIFSANANGSGVAAAQILRVHADGRQTYEAISKLDTTTNRFVAVPIQFGPPSEQLFLILYGTGFRFRNSLDGVIATVGTTNVNVTYAGAQGFLAGLDQVNLRLLPNLSGIKDTPVSFSADGVLTNTVRVSFQ